MCDAVVQNDSAVMQIGDILKKTAHELVSAARESVECVGRTDRALHSHIGMYNEWRGKGSDDK